MFARDDSDNGASFPSPPRMSIMRIVRPFLLALALVPSLALADSSEGAFVSWSRERAVPIESGRFEGLDGALDGVRLIGVGESVHETETFLRFRRELLQDLVRRHGVTALVLESGVPEVMEVDAWVSGRTAEVDLASAMPGLGSLPEVRQAMQWLRAWNAGEGKARPVRVYGADLPARSGSMIPALDRLRAAAKGDQAVEALIDEIHPIAARIAHTWWRGATERHATLSAEEQARLAQKTSLLRERVDHLARVDPRRWEIARRLAFAAEQQETMLRLGAFAVPNTRDYALAENTLAVVEQLPPGERAVYWAHNAHVQRVMIEGNKLPPGQFVGSGLRFDVVLGDAYYAIGTAYGGPALDDQAAPQPASVDATLGLVQSQPFFLRLDAPAEEISAWLTAPRPMRFQVGTLTVPLGEAFDAIVWFDRAVAVDTD